MLHRAQVHDLWRRRVDRRAAQQRHALVPLVRGRAEGILDLAVDRHARGEDQRDARGGRPADQRQVDDLEGGDLHGRDAEPGQLIDRVVVERSREEVDATSAGVLGQLRLPVARQGDRLQQLLRGAIVLQILELRGLGRVDRCARVGLELHRVATGIGRRVDQLAGDIEVAVVVGAGLGDHVTRGAAAHRLAADLEARPEAHSSSRSSSTTRSTSVSVIAGKIGSEIAPP